MFISENLQQMDFLPEEPPSGVVCFVFWTIFIEMI